MAQAHQVLSIVGPTAVGKTAFAWEVARWLLSTRPHYTGVDFFSADSRQIYQGLEVISGADLPGDGSFKTQESRRFWQNGDGSVRWFGISAIKPDQDWSVAHFQQLVQSQTPTSWATQRLPIIVGGTGLYVNQALGSDPTLHVPPNEAVRDKAEVLSLTEMQAWLRQVAPEKFAAMNNSDQANPRRLVRAIEIALFTLVTSAPKKAEIPAFSRENMLILGLQDDFDQIEHRIRERVLFRWNQGAVSEVEQLLARYPNQKLPVFSATGIKPIMAYLAGQASVEAAQDKWFTQERQYAKRQLTWWQKYPEVTWFPIQDVNWQTAAVTLLSDWLS